MENCRLKVLESDEAVKFEMAVNGILSDLEKRGCIYEVNTAANDYFYKAVIKYSSPGSSARLSDDPLFDDDYIKCHSHCCYCSYYARDYGKCLYYEKPVKFAGTVCEHFESGRVKA